MLEVIRSQNIYLFGKNSALICKTKQLFSFCLKYTILPSSGCGETMKDIQNGTLKRRMANEKENESKKIQKHTNPWSEQSMKQNSR